MIMMFSDDLQINWSQNTKFPQIHSSIQKLQLAKSAGAAEYIDGISA